MTEQDHFATARDLPRRLGARLRRHDTVTRTAALHDKTFVVTGAGNGIGREVALLLLMSGARVAGVDLRSDALAETAGLARGAARRMSSHVVDITDADAVAALPEAVRAAHGDVDGLLNVAGVIQPFVPFADVPLDTVRHVMAVNFWGPVHTTKAFLPDLLDRPSAHLVSVSSMGGLAPVPGQTAYGASKAALALLTEGLYAELRGTPVQVTVVYPGGVSTHITENSGVTAPLGVVDTDGMSAMTTAADAARQVVDGMLDGRFRVVIGRDARVLDAMSRVSPRRATETIARRMSQLLDA